MSPHLPPRTGEDSYDVLDDALTALAARRGAWLGDELTVIGLLASLIAQAERCLPEPITTARLNGASWEQIAALLGTGPHEARLRFDPDSSLADRRWPYDT
jgi:hypothetical protein